MTSPGGVEVGRVSVRVVPDTSKFLAKAKKELEGLAKDLKVQVELVLDTERIGAELKKIKAQADGTKAKMDVEVDGDGVTREVRRIRQIAQKLVSAVKMTVGINLPASITRIKAEMKVIQKVVRAYELKVPIEFVGISKWLGILGAISAILLTIPHLIGAIGGAVNVVGGLLALLPALTAAAAFGIGALVVGMKGFFSALSQAGDAAKFEEALKKLTPSAREAARALAEFREPLSDIRKAVQESLFQGMADPLRDVKKLLPPIKEGLVGSAGGIREMAKAWVEMATSQKSIQDTSEISRNVTTMFENMRPAAANFGQAMRDITVVGTTFLPALGTAVSDVTGKFADWATKVRDSGRLEQIIQNAIDKVKQFGRIIADVTVGLQNIFRSMSGGREFLDIVEGASQGFREWSEAEDTQATLRRLANVMRAVAEAAKELFGQAFKSAGAILKDLEPFLLTFARGVGTVIAGAIRAVTPPLQAFARWLSENRAVMVPLVITLMAMVTAFKLLATVAKGVMAVADSIKAIKAASKLIGGIIADIGKFIVSLGKAIVKATVWAVQTIVQFTRVASAAAVQAGRAFAAWAASAVRSASFTARYYAIMAATAIRNWVKMAVAATTNAVKIAVVWIAQLVRMVTATVVQMGIAVAAWVAGWIRMAAVATANAIRMAAAWLIAMGPIAIIIAAVVALVALIIANWDSIVAATRAAWDAIWKWVSDRITDIVNFMGNIWDAVQDVIRWFAEAGQGIIDGIQAALTWLADIKDKILAFFKGAATWLWDTGKNLVLGLWNGWKAYFDDFKQAAINDGNSLVDSINGVFDIFSPSRVFKKIGGYLAQGLEIGWTVGMRSAIDTAVNTARELTSAFNRNVDISTDWVDGLGSDIDNAASMLGKFDNAMPKDLDADLSKAIQSDNLIDVGDVILTALTDGALVVEMDGRNVTKSVNARNTRNNRRG